MREKVMEKTELASFVLIGVMLTSLFAGAVSGAGVGRTEGYVPYVAKSDRELNEINIIDGVQPTSVMGHPRLWLRADDIPRLRSWAVDSNPLYREGLAVVAAEAKADMDAGHVPDEDSGDTAWVDYPCEMYAELFAFMSLISSDQATRDDYAQRARILLMHVMNEAAKGVGAEGQPFRDPYFATDDRSRWWGEGFALTVDWIYPYLSTEDKATIRQVFLRWCDENTYAYITTYNHPEPIGVVNDPALVSDPIRVRWAANNYYTAHMRNIGLMAMALDPADDPGNELRNYLGNATGAWLYVVDYLLRHDSRGGLAPEGFEYSPQSVGYVAQFLLALHTAGQDNPDTWGSQVVLNGNPFWDDMVTAYLHSLSPATVTLTEHPWLGEVYQPAWYGDGQNYWAPDFIEVFGPLGLYDYATGNTTRLEALRWIQTHMPPGGADELIEERVGDAENLRDAILYFMLFDPAPPSPIDPRPAQPLTFYAPGIGRLFARTGWGTDATWFTYALGWNTIDHQHCDGNQFEFYRQGEWLTKERTGYDIFSSDYHNTLALENDPPEHNDPDDYRHDLWQRGSQWSYEPSADGQILAHSFCQGYVYALGDATGLYNSDYEGSTDITHASRSIVWLKPDHIIVYDRAASQTAGRFKRFWLNLPTQAVVSGNQATMTTATGQQLFVTTLLPADAAVTSEPAEPVVGPWEAEPAEEEPMKFRLRVEAPGGPKDVRFLHVLQGAYAGASADPVALVRSSGGTAFAGGLVNETLALFPVNLDTPFNGLTYTAPAGTEMHLITGLTPNSSYDVVTQPVGNDVQVTISPGTAYQADSGGVLALKREELKTFTYYVAPTGNDSHSGTIDKPWRTIQHAAETLVAGETVLIRNGTYNEQVSTMRDGDATDGYIVFSAYPGETPIIDGTGVTTGNNGFWVEHSYIKLFGLEIRNWNDNGIWMWNADHIEISDCEVHDVWYGIGAVDGTHDFELNRVEMHHFTGYGFDASPSGGADCYNGTFNDCIAHTGRDPEQNVDGFCLGHGTQHDFVFNRCEVYDVYDGFDISARNTTLNRCSAHDCWWSGYKIWQDNVTLVNCLGYHNNVINVELDWDEEPGTTTLLNCNFVDGRTWNIGSENAGDSLHMYNCILAGGDNIGLAHDLTGNNYQGDYNIFHCGNPIRAIVSGENEFSLEQIAAGDWTAYSGQDAHSLVAFDPDIQLFRNLSAWDLHLLEGSIAIDNGTSQGAPSEDYDGNPRPQGAGYDIGCYEFISTPSVFDTGAGTYPSIMGIHKGKIIPSCNINVSRLYAYPCAGTGGHTESIELYENGDLIANGTWDGYRSDYHNITLHGTI